MKYMFAINALKRVVWSLAAVTALSSCVHDDCPPASAGSTGIYITVRDELTRESIGAVAGADIYVFDRDKAFTAKFSATQAQIDRHLPVYIPVDPASGSWIMVWGNVGGSEKVELSEGMHMDRAALRLLTYPDGYTMQPDDLYYGGVQLSKKEYEEVVISPKTAKLHITVRGLTDTDADKYFFTLRSHYDGYNMAGTPLSGISEMRFKGDFRNPDELVTSPPFSTIHYPSDATEPIKIALWYEGKDGSKQLASVEKDSDGSPLVPQPGKATHILICFRDTGELEVAVEITGWEEEHLWSDW